MSIALTFEMVTAGMRPARKPRTSVKATTRATEENETEPHMEKSYSISCDAAGESHCAMNTASSMETAHKNVDSRIIDRNSTPRLSPSRLLIAISLALKPLWAVVRLT